MKDLIRCHLITIHNSSPGRLFWNSSLLAHEWSKGWLDVYGDNIPLDLNTIREDLFDIDAMAVYRSKEDGSYKASLTGALVQESTLDLEVLAAINLSKELPGPLDWNVTCANMCKGLLRSEYVEKGCLLRVSRGDLLASVDRLMKASPLDAYTEDALYYIYSRLFMCATLTYEEFLQNRIFTKIYRVHTLLLGAFEGKNMDLLFYIRQMILSRDGECFTLKGSLHPQPWLKDCDHFLVLLMEEFVDKKKSLRNCPL
jgi:hypothetical protein